jgi:uncharacterized repeat protein (TIGR03803 family)
MTDEKCSGVGALRAGRTLIGVLLLLGAPRIATAQAPYTVLHSFSGYSAPNRDSGPAAALVRVSDGNLYGSTYREGRFNQGTIFRMTPGGVVTVLHHFEGGAGGANPGAALVQAADGNLYGTTEGGGAGTGVVFRVTVDGTFAVLHTFDGPSEGGPTRSALIQASDGNFYGTARVGGAFEQGTLFRMAVDGTVTLLHAFAGAPVDGSFPSAALVEGPDGSLYGTTAGGGSGGTSGRGTAFRLTPGGNLTILHAFRGGNSDAGGPLALVMAGDGNFYGISSTGGAYCPGGDFDSFCGPGTAFRMTPDGTVTLLQVWWSADPEPSRPCALTAAGDGTFYVVLSDGYTKGAIFRMAQTGAATLVHQFTGNDYLRPHGLVSGFGGTFYGTTSARGIADFGTIFRLDSAGTYTLLYQFAGSDEGTFPLAPPVQATDGNFYGTTVRGGTFDCGTVYKMTPAGATTVIYTFTCGLDGAGPPGLIAASDGSLYGVTSGGTLPAGVVFKLALDGTRTTLHAFNRDDGPGSLIQATDGNFYGTTIRGGGFDRGTVFRMTPGGQLTSLHVFTPAETGSPTGLLQASDGNLYGIASSNNSSDTIFRMTLSGVLTTLHVLGAGEGFEIGPLVQGRDGNLYGATMCTGGLFRLSLAGAFAGLASTGSVCREVNESLVTLAAGRDGLVYGTVSWGVPGRSDFPTSFSGTLFALTPATGSVVALHQFDTIASPQVGVVQAADGMLYGTAGGLFGEGGLLFRVNVSVPLPPAFVTATPASPGGVRLTWAPVPGATSYTITRVVNGHATVVASGITATSVTDITTMTPGAERSYVVTAANANGTSLGSVPLALPWGSASSRTPTVMVPRDYDGDGKVDVTVYRSATGSWVTRRSSTGQVTSVVWGAQDRPVPADYDGDGKVDLAVYRETSGEWFIQNASAPFGVQVIPMGSAAFGDLPVPADYDGDGKADPAVYRTSTGEWFILRSSTHTVLTVQWGAPALGDLPVPADYDGDRRADLAVYRGSTGEWFVWQSATGTLLYTNWGGPAAGDIPVPADYDGDGKADIAVYRGTTSQWFINRSSGGSTTVVWGSAQAGDVPVAADYDGDGKADLAVFRFTTADWFIWSSKAAGMGEFGLISLQFGQSGSDSVRAF